jgi:hypothetical protein
LRNATRKPFRVAAGIRAARIFVPTIALLAAACGAPSEHARTLRFSAPEGPVLNEFYREGPVAAHVVITPGTHPRIVIAFPAGNSGAALWLDAAAVPLSWRSDVKIEPVHRESPSGAMHGISAALTATGGPVTIRQAITGSVRVIRQYQDSGDVPPDVLTEARRSNREIIWQRRRLDGAAGYFLSLEVLNGSVSSGAGQDGAMVLSPGPNGELRLRITALTGDRPLTPIAENDLLNAHAAPDVRLRRMLTFLSYREKLLAGSWRFNTYFGRDTLMSLALLAPALQPGATEAGLAAVLERLNTDGEVAHEEDIGELAVLRRMRAGEPPTDAPLFDYKMIDDDFMLAPVAAHYFLETQEGRARAAAFLARQSAAGDSYGARLVRNFRFVVQTAAPFARTPDPQNLVGLKAGEHVGNWRDSDDGLGGGRYPYDVNGVFVPTALEAIARLRTSGILRPYLEDGANTALASAARMADTWLHGAPSLFDVVVASDIARAAVREQAQRDGVDPARAVDALGNDPVRYRAVSLDGEGRPVPILNSDEGFALLFLNPAPDEVERIADVLTRPFPAGLMTDVGLVVANPAYAPEVFAPRFDRNHYHGSVIWSWQQATFAAGIERQLHRGDLTESARASLVRARDSLHAATVAASNVRGSELWSWSVTDGHHRLESFGQREQHETESNAAQLWSTVYLAQPQFTSSR